MTRTWTQTLIVQLISLVILFASAAAFGLGRAQPSAPACVEAEAHPPHVTVATLGARCGLDEEVAPVLVPRRAHFGAARCTE